MRYGSKICSISRTVLVFLSSEGSEWCVTSTNLRRCIPVLVLPLLHWCSWQALEPRRLNKQWVWYRKIFNLDSRPACDVKATPVLRTYLHVCGLSAQWKQLYTQVTALENHALKRGGGETPSKFLATPQFENHWGKHIASFHHSGGLENKTAK